MEQGKMIKEFIGEPESFNYHGVVLNDNYMHELKLTIFKPGESMELLDKEIIDLRDFLSTYIGDREEKQVWKKDHGWKEKNKEDKE